MVLVIASVPQKGATIFDLRTNSFATLLVLAYLKLDELNGSLTSTITLYL